MTKPNPIFKVNTDITIRDLMDFAEFKNRIARETEEEEIKMILKIQSAELHMIIDAIVKAAVGNTTGFNYIGAYEIPQMLAQFSTLSLDNNKLLDMIGLTKKSLPNYSSIVNNPELDSQYIKDAKIILGESEETKDIVQPSLPNNEGKSLEEVAKLVLTKGESDDEYVKMVKETVIESIKQRGGRREAVQFLKEYAFKSLNWTDTEAHAFINRLKEVEEIVEPKREKKQELSEEESEEKPF